jgi:hypothetical protein
VDGEGELETFAYCRSVERFPYFPLYSIVQHRVSWALHCQVGSSREKKGAKRRHIKGKMKTTMERIDKKRQ